MQAGKQLDTSRSLPGFGLTSDRRLVLQTSPNKDFIQSPCRLSRTVLNMVGTLLCSKMKKVEKDQKAIPATWLEPGAGPCCLKPLHGLGSGPLVPLSDLSQAENSDATATCHLHTACLSYLQSFYLICVHVEVQTLIRVVFGRACPDSSVSLVQSTKTMFVSESCVDNKRARTFAAQTRQTQNH